MIPAISVRQGQQYVNHVQAWEVAPGVFEFAIDLRAKYTSNCVVVVSAGPLVREYAIVFDDGPDTLPGRGPDGNATVFVTVPANYKLKGSTQKYGYTGVLYPGITDEMAGQPAAADWFAQEHESKR